MSSSENPTVREVFVQDSCIEGLGLFAAQDFEAGQRIRQISVVREVTEEAPLRESLGEYQDHCDYPAGKTVLIGWPDRHVNHSCNPNAYKRYVEGAHYLHTLVGIQAGEEITFDYSINTTGGTTWVCNCGSRQCRQVVHGEFFDLPIAKQVEYLPLLSGWCVKAHSKGVEALKKSPPL